MFFLTAKITHEQLVDTIKTLRAEPGTEKGKQAILDLVDYFNPLISGILTKQIVRGQIYRGNAKKIKEAIISELTDLLLQGNFRAEEYKSTDIGKVVNYVEKTLKQRANKAAIDEFLGLDNPQTLGIAKYFPPVLKKFKDKYKRMPVLEFGNPDAALFAELWGEGKTEKKILEWAAMLGKDKIKSIYDTISTGKGGDDSLSLIDVLPSTEQLPDEVLQDKETADILYSTMKKVLDSTEYKVFTMYNDPENKLTKEDIAKQLNLNVKDVNRSLANAKNKLMQNPKLKNLYQSSRKTLIKFACDNFEVVSSKGTYRIARKNSESLIREVISAVQISVGYFDAFFKKIGYVVDSKETTPGARKTWYKVKTGEGVKLEQLAELLKKEGLNFRVDNDPSLGRGLWTPEWEIQPQGNRSYFLAVTKRRPKGEEWRMGLDV